MAKRNNNNNHNNHVSFFEMLRHHKVRPLVLLTVVILLVGTIAFHLLEGWDYLDSFYFSVMTLTTIGYGDLVPTTQVSKMFTVVFVFMGVGIILALINAMTQGRTKRRIKTRRFWR